MSVIVVLFLAATSSCRAQPAVDLPTALRKAVERSETVLDKIEVIKQAEERYSQAMGAILPSLNGVASYTQQQGSGGGNLSPSSQTTIRIGVTQPLFRGLREYAALRQSRKSIEVASAVQQQALQALQLDVAQNYLTILSLEIERKNLQNEIRAYEQRGKELKERVKIGRSRSTEVLTLDSSMKLVLAQDAQLDGQILATRELFTFLTGLPSESALQPVSMDAIRLSPLETYLERKSRRPDLKAADLNTQVADENIAIARGAHLPSIDLTGNYYFKRPGFLEDVKWDFGVALTLPIFNGGLISSRVSEAESQKMQTELSLQRAQRGADEEIRRLYRIVEADQRQIELLQEATDLAKRNFDEQTKEYRYGLVTNLDVLQALTNSQESQRTLDKARFTAQLDLMRLRTATGEELIRDTPSSSER